MAHLIDRSRILHSELPSHTDAGTAPGLRVECWLAEPIHRLSRFPSHPCPETHQRAQPLRFEALNARNARRTAITGVVTAAVDPTGGVPQPAPFPIAKTEYLRALIA